MRVNGWQTPFHILQLLTWIIFPFIMIIFYIFTIPLLSSTFAIFAGLIYGLTCCFTVYNVYVCTATNPCDDSIIRPSEPNAIINDDQVYCNVCTKYVHKDSRHCRLCDKCISVFDHHCKWLNNCVGKKNYRSFLSSVVSATTLLLIQVTCGLIIVYGLFADPETIEKRGASLFGCSTSKDEITGDCIDKDYTLSDVFYKILHGFMLLVLVPWSLLILQLALFHFQLCYEDITTYDYIVRKRKRKLAQEREQANGEYVPQWRAFCIRMGILSHNYQRADKSDDKTHEDKSKDERHDKRVSSRETKSEGDEHALIEAEVDDDLECLSSRSGSIGPYRGTFDQSNIVLLEKGSIEYPSGSPQPVLGQATSIPSRGFSRFLHRSSSANRTASLHQIDNFKSPTSGIINDDIPYLQTTDSPRSEAESPYISSTERSPQNLQDVTSSGKFKPYSSGRTSVQFDLSSK